MFYRLYCSSGNAHGLDEYLAYSELADDGYHERYLEISAHGVAIRYSRDHLQDAHGFLPEGVWDETEATKPEYGALMTISPQLFEAVWASTRCANDT